MASTMRTFAPLVRVSPAHAARRTLSSPSASPRRTARRSSGSPSRRHRVRPRWQPSLDDYIDMAAYLLRAERAAIARLPRLALAESALHAPFASFGGVEAYPTLVEQGAVLLQHLVKNHPLPTRTSAPRSCWWRGSSKPTACTGEQWTSR